MEPAERGELLIAILKDKSDFAILQDLGWYRIPVQRAPRRWPPRWLAFYQPKAFGTDAYRVRYFGEISDIQIVKRWELFPNELPSARSDQKYYRICLKALEEREFPILSDRPRRLVFVPTTWLKFATAKYINDLFDDSPLEDRLWAELKKLDIKAERQWRIQVKKRLYHLDFALFCEKAPLDIETDGDTWHAQRERIPLDNLRDNDVESCGWHVLRFNGKHINQELNTYCLGKIQETINRLDGLSDEGLVPRVFYPSTSGTAQQLTLFDRPSRAYTIEEAESSELE